MHLVQEAFHEGRISVKDLAKWLRLANVPVLGALCRLMPGFRDRVLGNPKYSHVWLAPGFMMPQ